MFDFMMLKYADNLSFYGSAFCTVHFAQRQIYLSKATKPCMGGKGKPDVIKTTLCKMRTA